MSKPPWMSDATDWPLGESVRLPATVSARAPARRPLPRAVWAIAAAAFVAGVLASAAAFSIGWRHQAQRGSATSAALVAATAKTHSLRTSLADARRETARAETQLAAARTARAEARAAAKSVSQDATALSRALLGTRRTADSVAAGAGSVGAGVDRVAGELKTLTAYLATTPTAQLDPGYVSTQTAYLAKQLDELKAARSGLAAAIGRFETGTKTLSDRAAALAGTD